MADNVTLPGTGTVVAADDVGSALHQYVKVEYGADNSATPVSPANPLPVCQVPLASILVERVSNTDGAATALTVFGATASQNNHITTIAVYNAHATTAGYIDFRDGTGGTVIFTLPLPPGGGAVVNFPVPLRQPTANTALAIDVSAAITTVYVSLVGFKAA